MAESIPEPSSPLSSLAEAWRSLPPAEREALLAALSPQEAEALLRDWSLWARPEQLPPPGSWTTWLYLAGRGAGKTRSGLEWVREKIERGGCRRVALVARTSADCRDVLVEGESGVLAISPS